MANINRVKTQDGTLYDIEDSVARAGVIVDATVSGNPISVNAVATEATTSMTIAPKQSLNGYDKPWAAGAGKNKLPLTVAGLKAANSSEAWTGNVCNMLGCLLEVLTDDAGNVVGIHKSGAPSSNIFFVLGTINVEGGYTLNGCPATGGDTTYFIYGQKDGGGTVYFRDTGSGGSGEVATADDVAFKIAIRANNNDTVTFYPMLRLSSVSDATFAPYSNICPISGITTATVQTTDGETTNEESMELGETVYGGSVNFNAGTGSKTMANIDSYAGETINEPWLSSMDEYSEGATPTTGAQVVYTLATPTTLTLTPDTLTMLDGAQTVSGNGETVTVTFEQGVKQYVDSKIPAAPTTDGEYALTCTVTSGVPAYSWEATS